MTQLIFVRGGNPFSWLICLFTWSTWSHVAISSNADCTSVTEATVQHGVRSRFLSGFLDGYRKVSVMQVDVPDVQAMHAFLREQAGKPYDWTAYIGFLLPWRRWQDPDRWFCSELAAAALQAGGWKMPDASRITPRTLRLIAWGN